MEKPNDTGNSNSPRKAHPIGSEKTFRVSFKRAQPIQVVDKLVVCEFKLPTSVRTPSEVQPLPESPLGRYRALLKEQRHNSSVTSYRIDLLNDTCLELRPVIGKKLRGPDQHDFAAALDSRCQFVYPSATSVSGKHPFVKPNRKTVVP
jgi:hypothetical protein